MRLRSFQSQGRPSGATVHKVLGRPDPVVVRDGGGRMYENGELVVLTEGSADRASIDALLDSGSPLLLQFPLSADERDRWIAHTDHVRSRVIDKAFVHDRDETISWQEVGEPSSGEISTETGDPLLI